MTLLLDSLAVPKRVGGAELHLVRINARFQTEVFDEFCGTVHARTREGFTVLDDIREALAMVYEEADSHGVFDVGELRRVYGEDYDRLAIDEMDGGGRWRCTTSTWGSTIATSTPSRPTCPSCAR